MKRKQKKILALLLACVMGCVPAAQVMAATAYGVSAEMGSTVLFPGDSLTGIAEGTVLTVDGETAATDGAGGWTNASDSAKAYRVAYQAAVEAAEEGAEGTPASVSLTTAGYILTVVDGTSETAQDGGTTDNHYTFTEEEKTALAAENTSKDIAYYQSGESVKIKAAEAPEGYEFAGWSTETEGVSIADPSSAETTVTMPEKQVTIQANYQEKAVETQAETQVETQAETQAEAQVETQAETQTETQDTDAGTQTESTDGGSSGELVIVLEESYGTGENGSGDGTSGGTSGASSHSVTVNYDTGAESYVKTDTLSYTAGEVVEITAGSVDGYEFSYWFVSSLNVSLEDTAAATITFTMPDSDVEILAEYAVSASANVILGEAQATETEGTAEAAEITESVETEAADTTEASGDSSTDETNEENNEGIIIVTYSNEEEETDETSSGTGASMLLSASAGYTVTVEYSAGAESTTTYYTEGETVTLTADEIEGYTFSGWTVSPESVSLTDNGDGTYSFVMPAENVTVSAAYTAIETEPAVYTVTVDGSLLENTYEAGAAVTISQPSRTGYVFSGWTDVTASVTGLTDNGDGTWTFVMSSENVSLTSSFTEAEYTVTITNGTTSSGVYTFKYGSTVSIAADTIDGKEFSQWVNSGLTEVSLVNASSATTSFTMPAGDVALTAEFVNLPDTYTVKVSNGLIDGTYTEYTCEEGTQITVTANTLSGQEFAGWTVNDGALDLSTLGVDASSSSISLSVTQDMKFVANYTGTKYNVTVTNGTADYSSCAAGTIVTLTAAEPAIGYAFDYWTVDTQNVTLANASGSATTFTMPSADVTVTAVYKQVQYTVSVENGSAGQTYFYYGDTVTISSNYPASGKEFSAWSATSGNVTFADASRATTTFTMPASNVTIAATYEDAPTEADNYIDGITSGGSYAANEKLTFTPVGAGMSNSNPNPGDVRYAPTGYQIGNVSNTWSSSPYETSMSIKKTGEYTLKVTFARQVWDGSSWVADGTTSTTSVTFNIVTSTESVETGDTTPIVVVAVVAALACLVFVVLLVIFVRRRKKEQ